uniref:Uncharacterized protein n=1 Tax=Spironucleus salmonicida TaxID=348837 RepID=V6LKB6_9EUKA|eukprot:EST45080.1 Hypothetical protein SS50377_15100 [Spironucleus salmonicida]
MNISPNLMKLLNQQRLKNAELVLENQLLSQKVKKGLTLDSFSSNLEMEQKFEYEELRYIVETQKQNLERYEFLEKDLQVEISQLNELVHKQAILIDKKSCQVQELLKHDNSQDTFSLEQIKLKDTQILQLEQILNDQGQVIASGDNERQTLQAQLDQMRMEYELLEQQMNNVSDSAAEPAVDIAEMDAIKAALAEKDSQVEVLMRQLEEYQRQILELVEANDQMQADAASAMTRLAQLDSDIASGACERESLSKQVQELREQEGRQIQTEEVLVDLTEQIQSLQQELNDKTQEFQQLEQILNDQGQVIASGDNERQTLQAQLDQMRMEYELLEQQMNNVSDSAAEPAVDIAEMDAIKAALAEKDSQVEVLMRQLEEYQRQIFKLGEAKNKIDQKVQLVNLSSPEFLIQHRLLTLPRDLERVDEYSDSDLKEEQADNDEEIDFEILFTNMEIMIQEQGDNLLLYENRYYDAQRQLDLQIEQITHLDQQLDINKFEHNRSQLIELQNLIIQNESLELACKQFEKQIQQISDQYNNDMKQMEKELDEKILEEAQLVHVIETLRVTIMDSIK